MWFNYRGFDSKGTPKKGTIEGIDEEDVLVHLRTKGIFGVSLEKLKNKIDDVEIVDAKLSAKSDIKTLPREDIVQIRFNYEDLRKMLRSILLDVGVTEDVLRALIIDLKSDNVEKQKKVIEFVESMGFEKEALELSKAFLFRTDFNNTKNPDDEKDIK
ncbi:MAG: hypothetical protein ACD_79C01356G0006 [uncultured bacterium]|nr:MAG: hypothetical protein ACD_79C01356G0006 [uncultured bacterium]